MKTIVKPYSPEVEIIFFDKNGVFSKRENYRQDIAIKIGEDWKGRGKGNYHINSTIKHSS